MEKLDSGVLCAAGLLTFSSLKLSAFSAAAALMTTPSFCTNLISELDSNENEWLRSLAFRRLKQMNTSSRNVLPPMANTTAVTMLIMDLSLRADSVCADVGDGNGLVSVAAGHGAMSEAMPHSPLLLRYLKPCERPNKPVTPSNFQDHKDMTRTSYILFFTFHTFKLLERQ